MKDKKKFIRLFKPSFGNEEVEAIKKIFNLKKRPKTNPLIVHYKNLVDLNITENINDDNYTIYLEHYILVIIITIN